MTTTTEVARLQYRLEATTDRLESQLKRAQRQMQRSTRSMERDVSRVDRSVMALGSRFGALLPAVTVTAITAGANRVLSSLDEIGKTATRLGLTAEALQELRSAAEQSGVASNTLDMALQRLQRRVAEARQGTGEAKAALEEMGIELNDASGAARPLEDILAEVSDRLAETEDAGTRTRLAFKLFDSEGVSLIQMLGRGSKALEDMRDRARELGNVIDNETIDNAEALRTEIDLLANTITSRLTKAVGIGAKALNELFNIGNRGRIKELEAIIANPEGSLNTQDAGPFARRRTAQEQEEFRRRAKQAQNDARAELAILTGGNAVPDIPAPQILPATTGGGSGATRAGSAREAVDTYGELVEQTRQLIAATQEQIEQTKVSGDELDRLRNRQEAARLEQRLMNDAIAGGLEITPELREEIGWLVDEYQKQLDTLTTLEAKQEEVARATAEQARAAEEATLENERMADSLARIGTQATSVKGAMKELLLEITRISASGFFGGLFGSQNAPKSGLGGFFAELGSSVLTGAFANGTNSAPGGLALVGERGPEVVNLPRGSQVIPNHKLGMGGVNIVVNNNSRAEVGVAENSRNGMREIQIGIEETVAASIGRPGSKVNNAINNRNSLVRR